MLKKKIITTTSTISIGSLALAISACAANPEQTAETLQPATVNSVRTAEAGIEAEQIAASPEDIRAANRQRLREAILRRRAENQQAADENDPVICVTEPLTGSRLRKATVCARESERDALRSATRIGLDDLHRRSSTSALNSGG